MVQHIQQILPHGRPRLESPSAASAPKRQKLEQGSSSRVEEYSPSQTPTRIDDEASLREQLRQIG